MDITPFTPTPTDEVGLKVKFAGYLYERPDNAIERMNAAKLLFPLQSQTGIALTVAQEWPLDPVVIAELDRLGSSGADKNLPTKADIARRYINLADDRNLSVDTRLKALDKYSELMGYKPRPDAMGPTIGNLIDNRRVFVLPSAQPMNEWEAETMTQQATLIEGSARRVG